MKKFLFASAVAMLCLFSVEAKADTPEPFVFVIIVQGMDRPGFYSPGGETKLFATESECQDQVQDRVKELKDQKVPLKAYACVTFSVAQAMEDEADRLEMKKNSI